MDLIEESLESLDFFKVTNLGRINRNQQPGGGGAIGALPRKNWLG